MATSHVGGLEGVVAAETRLSEVDGEAGRLVVSGHDVEWLAENATFEQVAALLRGSSLPSPAASDATRRALGAGRRAAHARLRGLGDALDGADASRALRAALGHLGGEEFGADEAIGAVAVFAAAFWRRRRGLEPVEPDASLPHAADYLRMLRGSLPSPAEARALDAYLVTVADHGMNASTFAARVVASTGSDLASAIVAAVGALKGPLHGGAPGPVLDMLDAIGRPERAPAWVEAELAAGRRIMGMGHRVYRVRDPRAAVLEAAALDLERAAHDAGASAGRLALARAVERAAVAALASRRPERRICANVEFFTAVLLDALGLDRALFTPTFAVGRVAGWCAHFDEQRATGRLIRPGSRYVGPAPAGRAAPPPAT